MKKINEKTSGALKRIIEEVKEYRKAECLMKDCIVNRIIGGNDIDIIENWLQEPCKKKQTSITQWQKTQSTMKKQIKKLTTYVCPACKKKQTSITQWQKTWLNYNYNFKTKDWERTDEEDSIDEWFYSCPNCEEYYVNNKEYDKLIANLKKQYPDLP